MVSFAEFEKNYPDRIYNYHISEGSIVSRKRNDQELRNIDYSNRLRNIIAETFLPNGFPHSVRPEYLEYQIWDGIQGLCSYLRSVLATKSVLAGAGVGSATSTPLSAAITWVLKDGFGMIGSLVVAYSYANSFEVYTKEWRLCADFLNNCGLIFDLISSYYPSYYFYLITLSSISKSCCGLIAGATKARISAHFAHAGHLADISAKESTQETAIALIGLSLGSVFAQCIGDDDYSIWTWFFLFLCVHMYANYRLIRVLQFNNINCQRAWLLVQELIESTTSNRSIEKLTVQRISSMETLWRPFLLTWQGPRIGISFSELQQSGGFDGSRQQQSSYLEKVLQTYQEEFFIVSVSCSDRRRIVRIAVAEDCSERQMMKAYLEACYIQMNLEKREENTNKVGHHRGIQDSDILQLLRDSLQWSVGILDALQTVGWTVDDAAALGVGKWRYKRNKKVL